MSNHTGQSRDPQQKRVYEWERACVQARVSSEMMSVDEITSLVLEVALLCGFAPPLLRTTTFSVTCYADMHNWLIYIAEWGRNYPVILHELAHFDSWDDVLRGDAPHGPLFVGSAMRLYNAHLGLTYEHLTESAKRFDVQFILKPNFVRTSDEYSGGGYEGEDF